MKLIINKDRSVIQVGTWGTKNENDFEIVDFEFPEELEGYNKRIVYLLGGGDNPWDVIIDNKAYITNEITSKENVKGYVLCTKENPDRPADTDFRSREFDMPFYENEPATGLVPTPVQVDGFNTMLTAMNAKIDEVDALETTIGAAEAQRQEAEATRVSNENTRESNESTRQTNEQTRQTQEADRERRTDEAIGNIEDKTAEYNANAEAKTTAFNNNATQKTNDFNTNATTQKTDFNSNASSKTSAFNSNAETKTNAFNTNATNKTNAFNSNATEKTTAFDNNASTKTSEFNTNAESKTSAFNDNATQKTTNFDNNASEKTDEFNTNAQNKIDEYDEHIVEYQAQIDELQEEVEELSENMPWNTTEQATEISVDDAAKYSKNKLELFGNTEQETSILPDGYKQVEYIQNDGSPYIETSVVFDTNMCSEVCCRMNQRGISILGASNNNKYQTNSSWGAIHFNAIRNSTNHSLVDILATEDEYKSLDECETFTIKNQKNVYYINSESVYTFNEEAFVDENTIKLFYATNARSNSSRLYYAKFWSSEDVLVRYFIPCINPNNEVGLYDLVSQTFFGNAGTGKFIAGNEVTIPNPDYPQDIHVVTGNNTIEVQGKNLIDYSALNKYNRDLSGAPSVGSPLRYYNNSKALQFNVSVSNFVGKNIFFSFDFSHTNFRRFALDTNGNYIETFSNGGLIKENYSYITILINSNVDIPTSTDIKFMAVQGSTATSYVPYYHADYPINLGSLELCKIGDYKDYFYKENGNWYKYEKILKADANSNWYLVSSTPYQGIYQIQFNNTNALFIQDSNARAKSNMYMGVKWGDSWKTDNAITIGRNIVRVMTSNYTSINDFKEFLSNNNFVAYYVIDVVTPVQITDETLIAQLDEIYEHLQLVKGTNNISITASDLKPYMELSYMQDLPSKLDNLDSRLSLLE